MYIYTHTYRPIHIINFFLSFSLYRMCLLHLISQIYWHETVYSIPFIPLMSVESIVMSSLIPGIDNLCFLYFLHLAKSVSILFVQRIHLWFYLFSSLLLFSLLISTLIFIFFCLLWV